MGITIYIDTETLAYMNSPLGMGFSGAETDLIPRCDPSDHPPRLRILYAVQVALLEPQVWNGRQVREAPRGPEVADGDVVLVHVLILVVVVVVV